MIEGDLKQWWQTYGMHDTAGCLLSSSFAITGYSIQNMCGFYMNITLLFIRDLSICRFGIFRGLGIDPLGTPKDDCTSCLLKFRVSR